MGVDLTKINSQDPGPSAPIEERIRHIKLNAVKTGQDPRDTEMQIAKLHRDSDLSEGRKRGEELFADGSIGRVDAGRSKEIADIIGRRDAESKGFSDEEQNAFREKNQVDLNQSLAGKMRALKVAQAQSGVRGGLASAQQARVVSDANKDNVTNERELFLKNIDARRQGLNSYEQSVGGARKDELERTMYNQAQLNKEKLARLGTELGYGSLGAGERSAMYQKWAGEDQAKATLLAAKEGGGCCFIFLEARYGDGTLDHVVRKFRDEMLTKQNRRGYYKISEVLVPLMRKSKVVKFAVRAFMTDPLVAYGRAYYGEGSKLGFVFKPVKNFWLKMFDYLGGDHPFIRENGEVV